ncbi:type II toxin-antitoxin system RelE/ParE family toxin [Nitrospira sp. M1]
MILRFRPDALRNLEEIYEYIAADSQKHAGQFIDLIESKCETLAQSPFLGRLRPDLRNDVRSFPLEQYIIFYRVLEEDNVVEIIHVYHGARDVDALFE